MAKDSGEQNSRQFLEALQGISVEHYTYDLPEERIAKFPLAERDASRLLVYRDGTITERPFRDAPALFGGRETLVFNNTRVIHARLLFRKSTGALIEIFCLPLFCLRANGAKRKCRRRHRPPVSAAPNFSFMSNSSSKPQL